jgi:hypothetical protein
LVESGLRAVGTYARYRSSIIVRAGYPFDSPDPKGLCFAARFFDLRVNDLVAGYRIDGDGLLREAKEQLSPAARPAPVEPERELIQIVVQVFVADRTLMRSQ